MTHLTLLLALAVATPSTRPAAAPQLSAREIHDLHVQAVALMRQNQYNQAADFLEKVYNAVALEKRDRALVLNHAILDLTQKRFVMRGMRDLSAYLIKHRDEDEPGMNILGALLNTAIVDQPTLKSGALWQSDLKRAADEQADVVNRAIFRLQSLAEQQANAFAEADKYNRLRNFLQQVQTDPLASPMQKASASQNGINFQANEMMSVAEAQRLYGEYSNEVMNLQQEQVKLRKLKTTVIRPDWPTSFDPIDPDAPWPPPTTQPGAPPVEKNKTPQAAPGRLYPDPPPAAK